MIKNPVLAELLSNLILAVDLINILVDYETQKIHGQRWNLIFQTPNLMERRQIFQRIFTVKDFRLCLIMAQLVLQLYLTQHCLSVAVQR